MSKIKTWEARWDSGKSTVYDSWEKAVNAEISELRARVAELEGQQGDRTLLQRSHELGFLRCAGWAQRDDLFADVGSPAYKKDRAHDLSTLAKGARE